MPFSNNLEKVLKENGLDTKRTKTFHTFTEKLSREQLIESTKKKDTGFDLYWLAIAFKNAELLTQEILETYMVDQISLKELKQFFKNWQEEIVKEIL